MKTIASVAIAILTLSTSPTQAHDWNKKKSIIIHTHTPHFCAPHFVYTKEICRRVEWRTGYNHCGHPYMYKMLVITYADVYSNGSSRQYTRTYRV